MTSTLPVDFQLGPAALRVSDAESALDFYVNKVGLELRQRGDTSAMLGTRESDLLRLDIVPGIAPRNYKETGLYHVAILLPDRPSLGAAIARLAAHKVKLGAADHLVSEAIYVWDPDNNGIEIYRDRPRHEWTWQNDQVQMANRPLDFEGLLAEPDVGMLATNAMKNGTRIGHVHLEVDDLVKAKNSMARLSASRRLQLPRRAISWRGRLSPSFGGEHLGEPQRTTTLTQHCGSFADDIRIAGRCFDASAEGAA
ncbi:MAG: VOC family protein [Rhizobiales bacterium]|nr:VOC family protein [Hyphomicrobiales bacterium]